MGESNQPGVDKRSLPERALKWVGALTAVLSLAFAVHKATELIAENNERQRQIDELTQLADVQGNAGDYAAAWESLGSALQRADSGGTLAKLIGNVDEQRTRLRRARENVAMVWLSDIRTPADQKFSDVVDRLLPALEQGSLAAEPQRKADLIAHIGWAYFLRSRDGVAAPDPQRQYDQALQLDDVNPYAHAYAGHWLMWNGGSVEQATRHFEAGLGANRARELVRRLQLSAYKNRQSGADVLFVRTVSQMLANGEPVDPDSQRLALWHVQRACAPNGSRELLTALRQEIGAGELLNAYRQLQASSAVAQATGGVTARIEACLATEAPTR